MLDFFGGVKFFRYPLPLSEVIYSFLFLRNTFQFLGRHSKCDVWRVSHHWETGKTWQNKCFERNPLKCPQSLRECCAIKTACTFLYNSCEKRWFPGKFWIWALVAAFSSVWDVYWCNHIQALTFRTGSQTPGLDSKMCQFPRISLSELWKVRSFRLILHQGLLASPFCVGFLSTTVQKWSFWAGCWIPALVAGNIVQKQIWHHLFRPKSDSLSQNLLLENDWRRTCEWNNSKRNRWTHSKCCPETVPNARKRTKPQYLKMTCITCLNIFLRNSFITLCRFLK